MLCVTIGFVGSTRPDQADQQPPKVSAAEANKNLTKRVEPEYPALAKTTHTSGTVRLQAIISTTGKVKDLKVINGHPFLVGAALKAVRQWEYKPFSQGDTPVEVTTEIDLDFVLQGSASEKIDRDNYQRLDHQCRSLYQNRDYGGAEKSCKEAVQSSERLPEDLFPERFGSLQVLGYVYFSERKLGQSQEAFEQEWAVISKAIAQARMKPDEPDVGYAARDLARVYHANGQAEKAETLYKRALAIFETAIQGSYPEHMKRGYIQQIKKIVQDYSLLLKAQGRNNEADELESNAKSLRE